jgi:hypothetical protein
MGFLLLLWGCGGTKSVAAIFGFDEAGNVVNISKLLEPKVKDI